MYVEMFEIVIKIILIHNVNLYHEEIKRLNEFPVCSSCLSLKKMPPPPSKKNPQQQQQQNNNKQANKQTNKTKNNQTTICVIFIILKFLKMLEAEITLIHFLKLYNKEMTYLMSFHFEGRIVCFVFCFG
jgi:hypothetical protein